MADWVDVLGDIPQAAIDQAASQWLRENEKRPTPAGIRKLALRRIEEPKKPPPPDDDEWPFRPVVVSAEELERRRAMAEKVGARLKETNYRVQFKRSEFVFDEDIEG